MAEGRRLADGEFFERIGNGLQPGDYGRELVTQANGEAWWEWFVCCPNGTRTKLWVNEDDRNGNRHIITEHDDGTITVEGSILGRPVRNCSGIADYHGWLKRGVWSDA